MASPNQPPGLIQRYREELQVRHYARRTVSSYELGCGDSCAFTSCVIRAKWGKSRSMRS